MGKYNATSGTLEMSWLRKILIIKITPTEVRFSFKLLITDWKKPESQTLSIRTNMAAKKIRVYQSISRIIVNRLGLTIIMGKAEIRLM
jgi:hypothetical protein